jgi:hypothetical protein
MCILLYRKHILQFTLLQPTKESMLISFEHTTKNLNSVALIRKRTTPTERPPLVGEVSAKVLRVEGVSWSSQRTQLRLNNNQWYSYYTERSLQCSIDDANPEEDH